MTLDPVRPRLLAVDLGLRSGLAQYGADGHLLSYRSTHFGSLQRLKKGVPNILKSISDVQHVVVEGDRQLGEIWHKWARHRCAQFHVVSAETWRNKLLLPRKQVNRKAAKDEAGVLARKVIAWSGLNRPTSLRHDAAEAILIGLWAVLEFGWLDDHPLK
ncbi:MAG: hypothetical protein VX589_11130 [Myxococcota bacterium]|nr:hypothetical protein [Myxococcota bacterium]